MQKEARLVVLFLMITIVSVSGQCPRGDTLTNIISSLTRDSTLSKMGKIKVLSQYEDAIVHCVNAHDSLHANLFRKIGAAYSANADFIKAIHCFQNSVDLIKKHATKLSFNPKELILSYYWLGALNDSLHRINEKMRMFDSCYKIGMRLNAVDRQCLWALYSKAEYSFIIGDYHQCIVYSSLCENLAIDYSRRATTRYDTLQGLRYANSSFGWYINSLLVLKRYDEAEKLIIDRIVTLKKEKLHSYLGLAYGSLAEIYVFKKDYKKAWNYSKYVLSVEKDSGSAFNYKATLNSIGFDFYFNYLKDFKKAKEYYLRALNYKVTDKEEVVQSSMESLNILNRLANLFIITKQYDSAFRYFQLAFDQIAPGINENSVLNISVDEFARLERIRNITTLIIDKADAFRQRFKTQGDTNSAKEAIRIYKVADQFLEKTKSEQSDVRSKLYWLSDRRKLYEHAIDACYSVGNSIDAFYFFERSRAILLYDQMNEQRLIGEEQMLVQARLKRKVNKLERELASEERLSDRSKDLRQELVECKQELDQINDRLKSKNPLYYKSFFGEDKTLLKEVQSILLAGNGALVELFDGDSSIYTLMITSNAIYLSKLDKLSFDKAVDDYLNYLSDHSKLNKDFPGFVKSSQLIYELLFRKHNLPPGKIIISPDKRYFPIESLLTNMPGQPNCYLIETHPISYIHSGRFLTVDFNSDSRTARNDFLGVAPVNFQSQFQQASLIGSDLSLQTITSNFRNADQRTFTGASRNSFLSEFGEYNVIQLYTHASSQINEADPKIYFEDSVLYLSDLMNEKKPLTKLIVLSACETGSGKWEVGEGVYSFNRGFAALGIPSTVTNLWSIEDKATYRLTELFYKYLSKGMDMDIALQKAKLEFINSSSVEDRLPYYWAPAILAGKTQSIKFSRFSYGEKMLLASGVLLLIWTLIALFINSKFIFFS